ncbi:MAG TPA: RNA polymerase sigma factor [Pirellulales bacterium]|nr:RNA polymerase sigma factor [Pirellulales bacterium]
MLDFDAAYAEHHTRLLAIAIDRLGCQDGADVVANVWAKAWKRRASYDPARGTVGAWPYRICRSVMIDHFRRPKLLTLHESDEPEAPDDPPDPPDLAAAISRLPDDMAVAVRTLNEAAKMLGCPTMTLHYRAQNGLRRLRKILAA